MVEAPSVDESIEILKGLRPKYEAHHKAKMSDAALEAAAKLSDRYLTGRFLPDKAIDVMDEAGARARINATMRPPDVKNVEAEIEEIRGRKEASIKAQDFEKAASQRDTEKQAKDRLEKILADWREQREEREVVVTEDDIMHIVSKFTGVPLQRMEQKETQQLLAMEGELRNQVIGQDEAVQAVAGDDFSCPEDKVKVTPAQEKDTFAAAGCGKKGTYVCEGWDSYNQKPICRQR